MTKQTVELHVAFLFLCKGMHSAIHDEHVIDGVCDL